MHFAAPIIAALAAFSTAVEARAKCDRKAYADVAHKIYNPAYFCNFYNKQKRLSSPLPGYSAKRLTNICNCFKQNSPRVKGPFRPLHPKPAAKNCPTSYYRALKNQYKNVDAFSRWYLSAPRQLSPIPSLTNPKAVVKACHCWLNRNFPAQKAGGNGNGSGGNDGGNGGGNGGGSNPTTNPTTDAAQTTDAPQTTDAAVSTTVAAVDVTTSAVALPITDSAASSSSSSSSAPLIVLPTLFPSASASASSSSSSSVSASTASITASASISASSSASASSSSASSSSA